MITSLDILYCMCTRITGFCEHENFLLRVRKFKSLSYLLKKAILDNSGYGKHEISTNNHKPELTHIALNSCYIKFKKKVFLPTLYFCSVYLCVPLNHTLDNLFHLFGALM